MRKKLFAILMSAMMMVTFMPSMAFAAFPVSEAVTAEVGVFYVDSWADDYTTVAGHYYTSADADYRVDDVIPTVRNMIINTTDADRKGKIAAKPDLTYTGGICYDWSYTVDGIAGHNKALYYDFDTLTMTIPKTMTYTQFATAYMDGGKVRTKISADAQPFVAKVPSYDVDNNRLHIKETSLTGLAGQHIVLNVTGYDVNTPYVDQTVTITATVTPKDPATALYYTGTLAPVEVKVLKKVATANDVNFYVDKVKTTADFANNEETLTYDGAAHTIVTNEVPGFTVSYEQVNATTNRYEAVTAASFKDYGTYYVRATVKNTAGVTKRTEYLTVDVAKAKIAATFGTANINVVMQGTTIDPMNFVKFTAVSGNANAKKAIAADEAALKAALATRYDIVAVKAENTVLNDATLKALSITNIVDVYALKAVEKKPYDEEAYGKATANFEINVDDFDEGYVVVVTGNLDNEIEFVQAPAVMKYHNKKGVLKKSYSFTVKAVATSGVAPTYKLINGNNKIVIDKTTGKITVKKGLKKGTYTVKVKAYGAAGNGYKAASETQTIKIVLTK